MPLVRDIARILIPRPVRNWLRAPRRSLRWVANALSAGVGYRPVLEIRPGWKLRCHPAAHRVFRNAQMHDPDQARELDAFLERCSPGMVLFDIGAHFGIFSFAALRYGGPTARAVAVDPSAFAIRVTRRTAALNGLGDRITVIQAAAGATDGDRLMLDAGILADGYLVSADDRPPSELTRVRGVTVDSLAANLGLGPTHLKIDVEGAEAGVLGGASRTLTGDAPPTVFLELHADILRRLGADPAEPLDLLERHGYRFVDEDGGALDREALLRGRLTRFVAEPVGHRS